MAHTASITSMYRRIMFPPVSLEKKMQENQTREKSEVKEQVSSVLPPTQQVHPNQKPDQSLPLPLETNGESDACVNSSPHIYNDDVFSNTSPGALSLSSLNPPPGGLALSSEKSDYSISDDRF